jgi:hypothetical protein
MVTSRGVVHNGQMATDHGWIGCGPGDNSHLTEEQREWVGERIRKREESKGGLLGIVEVRVYEHGCEPQVSFPQGAHLGVETDTSVISDMVTRARNELSDWR